MIPLKKVLSFAMLVSLAACGGSDDPVGSGGGANGSAGSDSVSGGASAAGSPGSTGGDGSSGGGSVDASNCQAVGAQQKAWLSERGCVDNSAELEAGCKSLYATNTCTAEWEPLIDCLMPKPASDFECDDHHKLKPKTGVCTAQRSAFDACTGN